VAFIEAPFRFVSQPVTTASCPITINPTTSGHQRISVAKMAMVGRQLEDLPLPGLHHRTEPKFLSQVTEPQVIVIVGWANPHKFLTL